ncbi:MAG: hypothetical protein RBU23_00285 [Candidatus Auribacterota bacterium]|nr:hypothetical protein [Candidatus Auribacterota bacterium]
MGHEVEGILLKGQDWSEAMMDLHNNSIGREAGNSGNAIDNNKLIISPDDASNYNPYKGRCSQ